TGAAHERSGLPEPDTTLERPGPAEPDTTLERSGRRSDGEPGEVCRRILDALEREIVPQPTTSHETVGCQVRSLRTEATHCPISPDQCHARAVRPARAGSPPCPRRVDSAG